MTQPSSDPARSLLGSPLKMQSAQAILLPDHSENLTESLHWRRASALLRRFEQTRKATEELCQPLQREDYVIQSMPDASPPKWHLGHTSWFFDRFVLAVFAQGYRPFHPLYDFIFNSYYVAVGNRVERSKRGLLSRPTVDETYRYRKWVDEQIVELLSGLANLEGSSLAPSQAVALLARIEVGIQHEQQHQELLLTDIKNAFWANPLKPAYRIRAARPAAPRTAQGSGALAMRFVEHEGGLVEIGHDGERFAFDNEKPRHKTFLEPYSIGSRLVTCGEYLEFMQAGGYDKPELWLSDGWKARNEEGWSAPLYWEKIGQSWWQFTLGGMRSVEEREPVAHVSFYEAAAYAAWKGARLPTEAEWENAACLTREVSGNLLESGEHHPVPVQPAEAKRGIAQLYGDVWEWTASPYQAYPGYAPFAGDLSEYNGKFMCNQMVLRGGSCATPGDHIRPTYRNFFTPSSRWQFSGFRIALR